MVSVKQSNPTEILHVGTFAGHIGQAFASIVVERVPPQGAPTLWEPKAGLHQTEEAKMFRRKLLKRPLALRCPTEYIQPHGLADIAASD